MSSTLTIAGTSYGVPDRGTARLRLQRLSAPNLDGDDSLEWSEHRATYPGQWPRNATVTLSVDGTQRFNGRIVSKDYGEDELGIVVGYRALGLSYLAQQVPVLQPQDGTTEWTFNRTPDDPDYVQQYAGLTVGQVLTDVLTATTMAGPLAAYGIGNYTSTNPYTLPTITTNDLAALAITPPQPVTISGTRLWNALTSFLAQWQRSHLLYIDPLGNIRVLDTTAFTGNSLTLDVDPVRRPSLSSSIQDCYTRVEVLGMADVEPAVLSTVGPTPKLAEDPSWSPSMKAAWTISDYQQPNGATDSGTVTAVTSTQVTVSSSSATVTWAANFWAQNEAQITLYWSAGSGLTYTETRRVTACSALTAGGTATVTLDYPLANSNYDGYRLQGKAGGRIDCWRLYTITDAYIAAHLERRFPVPVSWSVNGRGVSGQVSYPAAIVGWSSTGAAPYIEAPATFTVLPATGQVRFDQPTVAVFSTPQQLLQGGSNVVTPSEITIVVPYSRGNLTAVAPADSGGNPQYSGTAYTTDGLQRTLTLPVPAWSYRGNIAAMQALASMYLASVSNVITEGTIEYLGKYSNALTAGQALSLAHPRVSTGWETLAAPIRSVTLAWPQGGALQWQTSMRISTRRNPYTGDRLYVHPAFEQSSWGGGFGPMGGGESDVGPSVAGDLSGDAGAGALPPAGGAGDEPGPGPAIPGSSAAGPE